MPSLLLLLIGLAALVVGAELVVRSGSALARRLGIPPIVVGLTIVSLGTSAPELAVGIDAVRRDAGALAVGNIAGTNVVNLLLILGLSAAIRPLVIGGQTLRLDLPAMATASLVVLLLSLDGSLSVVDGVILTVLAIVYSALLFWMVRRDRPAAAPEKPDESPASGPNAILQLLLLVAGLVVIVLGADWLVRGAVDIATALGVSDALIGVTIVAIGTSAPELVTTLVSTFRGDRDIAIGNLIGSSTYNLTLVLGVSLLFAPGAANGAVPIDRGLLLVDLPAMVLVALVCIPVFLTGRRVSRAEGIAFVVAYAAFIALVLAVRP